MQEGEGTKEQGMKNALRGLIATGAAAIGMSGGLLWGQSDTSNPPPTTNALRVTAPPAATNQLPRSYSGYVFDRYEWSEVKDLPKGAVVAVLEGSPQKAGLYTVRYKFPAGYRIPLGWLSTDERVTVLSGVLNIGLSPGYDRSNSKAIGAGSFAFIPANMRFVAWTDEDTVIQVHGIGPSELHYANP